MALWPIISSRDRLSTIVPLDSDFGTFVVLALPPYNPLKERQSPRSEEYKRGLRSSGGNPT